MDFGSRSSLNQVSEQTALQQGTLEPDAAMLSSLRSAPQWLYQEIQSARHNLILRRL
jgi:hypothetical protein